jgi:uncharacterized protein (TIGR00369 family)
VSLPSRPMLPLHDLLGFTAVESETGRLVLAAEVRPELCNRRGVLHGGVLSALADSALGGAVVAGIAPEEWCATLQISVQFVNGARRGPLRAEGRMVRRGRRVAFAAGEIRDADGEVVATAQGTWFVWPRRPD